MIQNRHAPQKKENTQLRSLPAASDEPNTHWLTRAGVKDGILLLGGSSLAHFRIRVAQSHLRQDLYPSFWSLAGLLRDGKHIETVPLGWKGDVSVIPSTNGVQTCEVEVYDDPQQYPNLAVIRFGELPATIGENIEKLKAQRSIVDLPGLMAPWLAFVWGVGQQGNPLLAGVGVPSAVFVERVYAMANIELTPGLSANASCPEAIWQTAKWWHQYYEKRVSPKGRSINIVPTGSYATRQRAAAVFDPEDKEYERHS
ncbi:MAG TPA: hypothetical protein VGX03_36805 [Candidatus Binatia bacterium]|jgi:hypothetical protein|nr:hypothetical protein [Candidatus Binatia bacterium]